MTFQQQSPGGRSSNNNLALSYLELRCIVGCLGMGLPIVLALGGMLLFGLEIQSSISAYYYTGMRGVFVGSLWAIGIFLLSYEGHDQEDNWAGNIACFSGIVVALFPTAPPNPSELEALLGAIHLISAGVFLATFAWFSLRLFVRTHAGHEAKGRKKRRNWVYRICGYTILAALVCLLIVSQLPEAIAMQLKPFDPVFWLESVAIFAFGVSWFVKGQGLKWGLADKPKS